MHKSIYERHKFLAKEFFIHVLCWCPFIFSEVVVTGLLRDHFNSFYFYLLFYTLNISLFYFHAYGVKWMAGRYRRRMFILTPLLVATELAVYTIVSVTFSIFLVQVLKSQPEGGLKLNFTYYVSVIWRGVYFMLYSTGYFFLKNYLARQKKEMESKLEISRLQNLVLTAEKDFLRSQITPHLFFSTLNFIKFTAVKNPDLAEDAIDTLSEIMDFALTSNNREFVPLITELDQISNLVTLNQMRNEGKLFFHCKKEITDPEIPIIPLVLLTLTENLFKHGNLSSPEHPATIEISSEGNKIIFRSSNLAAKSSLERDMGQD